MIVAKYIYDYNCHFCQFLEPYIEQLEIFDDVRVRKVEYNNTMELKTGLPCFIVNDVHIAPEVTISLMLAVEMYPNLFKDIESPIDMLRYVLKNPKELPNKYKM